MRIFKLIFLIFILIGCNNSHRVNDIYKLDTLTIKIGDQHVEPTPTSEKIITLKNVQGEQITRFYSDSTYVLTVEHSFGVKLILFEKTENFTLKTSDSTFFLTTNKLDSAQVNKLRIGFLTDTTSNILMYHYRLLDENVLLNFKKRVDTVGYTEFKLYGRKSR